MSGGWDGTAKLGVLRWLPLLFPRTRTLAGCAPRSATYVGVFVLTLSSLMYEIVLTRIFSVTMWYHFAFVAISIALFGTTVGALIVHFRPHVVP